MHVILKKNLEELTSSFEFEEERESKLFEYFCNFCIISNYYLGRFNPKLVTTEENDASIDGIGFIIDGELIGTVDDANEVFSTHKSSLDTRIIITQVKSGEKFKKDEISNFLLGITDFLSLSPQLPNGELNKNALEIFNVVLNNLRKVKNKRPSVSIYYCTSGVYNAEDEIKASFNIIKDTIEKTDLFFDVSVFPNGRSELLKSWTSITGKNEAKLKILEFFGMPKMPGIPQSYITLVNAKQLVAELLMDSNSNMRNEVFEENIRAFLGESNPVNSKIKATLNDDEKKQLFSVLNNGITIVTPELTLTPNSKEIDLVNYQIINGCQTSNTLFKNFTFLNEQTNVVVKFIESSDYDKISDIISATNSQSNIDSQSFHSLKNKAKLVQKYFDIRNEGNSLDNHIFFERRENEYKDYNYQQSRIFDIKLLCRAYAAMFLNMPHNSARYVSLIFQNQGLKLFKDSDQEICYYTAALTLYKINALINSKKVQAHKYISYKWHIAQLFRHVVHGKVTNIEPNSNKVNKYCEVIVDSLLSIERSYEAHFEKCIEIISTMDVSNKDILKTVRFHADLMSAATIFLNNE